MPREIMTVAFLTERYKLHLVDDRNKFLLTHIGVGREFQRKPTQVGVATMSQGSTYTGRSKTTLVPGPTAWKIGWGMRNVLVEVQ